LYIYFILFILYLNMIIETRSWKIENFTKEKFIELLKTLVENNEIKDLIDYEDLIESFNEYYNENVDENVEIIHITELEELFQQFILKTNFELIKAHILHVNELDKKHAKKIQTTQRKLEDNTFKIIKTNWRKELFDINKIEKAYKAIAVWYWRECKWDEIKEAFQKYIVDGMKTSDVITLLIKSAVDLISTTNTNWNIIAWRLKLVELYKKAAKNRKIRFSQIYSPKSYKALFDEYVKKWLYYKDFYDYYSEEDILEIAKELNKDTDYTYNYPTMNMYDKRYLLNPNKKIKELPQEMYLWVALFLAIPEKKENRLDFAKKLYKACSTGQISLPTPTLLNARTNFHQLSSCFKFNVDDDLRAIYHSIENMAQVSKFGWWIWVYLWNIRSKWWMIRWNLWAAWGVNPWIKVINDTAVAVNQLWARAGAISVTLDVFHRDIYDFLSIQTETGDIRAKAFDVFPAVSFPDLFMERVANNEEWTLFDPKEVKDLYGYGLQDVFGEEFEEMYKRLENDDRLKLKEKTNAKELFKTYMKVNVETWMPYAFFRDTSNKFNPNKHVWNVYSSQLCCEIIQNTSPSKFIEETIEGGNIRIEYEAWDNVVCNLASINVAKVYEDKDIGDIVPLAIKTLDNVIDLNFYPIKETKITAEKYRAIGLWFLWLAEHLAVDKKLNYSTEEARKYVDILFEKYSYEAIKASNELAKERWTYKVFEWSEWSKWILLWKDKKWFETNSKMSKKWISLIDSVKKYGLRNWYLLSPAPNTSTSIVVWTTAWVLPIYKKYFVDNNSIAPMVNVAPRLWEENFWLYQEYVNMDINNVIDMMAIIQKWVDQSISFEWLINPEKTSPSDLFNYYFHAHRKGIKTIYYVRSMSLEVKKCESCTW